MIQTCSYMYVRICTYKMTFYHTGKHCTHVSFLYMTNTVNTVQLYCTVLRTFSMETKHVTSNTSMGSQKEA